MTPTTRDQLWLENRLQLVWRRGFSDLVPLNKVQIQYGQSARTRLGSIRMSRDGKVSKILINKLYQLPQVPLEVVDCTIGHELTHYLHGFSSPLKQRYKTPHAGGVVTKELTGRGFGADLLIQKRWLKEEWPRLLKANVSIVRRRPRRRSRSSFLKRLRRALI
jgi:hypothetical protein